jgi:hypothetical protein
MFNTLIVFEKGQGHASWLKTTFVQLTYKPFILPWVARLLLSGCYSRQASLSL